MRNRIMAAVAVFFLLAEGLLRVYAFCALRRLPPSRGEERARIWCVGDSNTIGRGADPGQSYPDQLEKALGRPILNLGVSGANSSQAVGRLERELLQREPPETVLFLAGVTDGWNLREVDSSLLRNSPSDRLIRRLQDLRLYQLGRALLLGLFPGLDPDQELLEIDNPPALRARALARKETKTGLLFLTSADIDDGDHAAALEHFERFLALKEPPGYRYRPSISLKLVHEELRRLALPPEDRAAEGLFESPSAGREGRGLFYSGRGWRNFSRGRFAEARQDFSALLSLAVSDGQRAEALQGLGWCGLRQGRPEEARRDFARAIKSGGPLSTIRGRLFWSHAGSVIAALELGDAASARRAFARLPAPLARSGAEGRAAELLRLRFAASAPSRLHAEILPVTSYLENRKHLLIRPLVDGGFEARVLRLNVARLARAGAQRGFRVVLLTYPQQSASALNDRIRGLAKSHGFSLIDLEGILADADGRRYFSSDGYHPGAEGYRRMAGLIGKEFSQGALERK